MRLVASTDRVYGDFLRAVYETFGRRSFTVQDLEDKGLSTGDNRNPSFFRNRGVFELRTRGRPYQWGLTQTAIAYMESGEDE